MKKSPTTHIEVTLANGGEHLGVESGHLLQVKKETNCFFFVKTHSGQELKVSKHTKRLCHWSKAATSPTFNI